MPCPTRPALSQKPVGQHLTCTNTPTVPLSHAKTVPTNSPQASDLRFYRLSHCPPYGAVGHRDTTPQPVPRDTPRKAPQ